MKETYEELKLELIVFEGQDIIMTSQGTEGEVIEP